MKKSSLAYDLAFINNRNRLFAGVYQAIKMYLQM